MSLSILPLTRDLLSYNRFSGVRCLSRTQFSSVSDRFAHAVEQLGKFRAEGVSGSLSGQNDLVAHIFQEEKSGILPGNCQQCAYGAT